MDLTPSADEAALRDEVRVWLRANLPWEYGKGLPPRFDDLAEEVRFGREWQAKLASGRWVGVAWPSEYGGRGLGPVEHYLVTEELARARAPELVGRIGILAVLDERGLADDTLVIATTDHGELLGHHQMIFKGPVHYDDLLRVPLIVRGPGFEAGDVRDDPVGTIDLAPTALAAAGVAVPDAMEGAPLHDTARREHVITEDDFDIVLRVSLRTLTTRRYKLTRNLDLPDSGELYDLQEDPGELVNRFDDAGYADVRKELEDRLATCMNHDRRSLPKVGLVG
jgi:N-sulfoglucosamine sulfohydrolase-like protein/acyl-CoA dehydrogenase-like protein